MVPLVLCLNQTLLEKMLKKALPFLYKKILEYLSESVLITLIKNKKYSTNFRYFLK